MDSGHGRDDGDVHQVDARGPKGTTIAPTGKRFALQMATIGHWSGVTMDHEWLFWDNADFYQQIGLDR